MVRLECPLCDYEYSHSNPEELEDHIYDSHLSRLAEDSSCPSCEVSFTRKNAQFHYDCFDETRDITVPKTDRSPSFGCPLCSKMVESERELRIHFTDHSNSDRYDLVSDNEGMCKFCGEKAAEEKVGAHSSCIADYASPDTDPSSTRLDSSINSSSSVVEVSPVETLSKDQFDQYISGLESFVDHEMELEKEEEKRRYEGSDTKRYIRGNDGVYNLAFTRAQRHHEYDTLFVYQYPEDHGEDVNLIEDFGVYPDSIALLDSEAIDELPVEVRVVRIEDNSVSVVPLFSKSSSEDLSRLKQNKDYSIAPILNPTPYQRRKSALSDAKRYSLIRSILSGNEMSISDVNISCTIPRELNSSQSKAVDYAVGAEDVFCIHGPPGTGKTRTLTSIIEVLVGLGSTVLACSHSNQATDNLLVGDSTRNAVDEGSLHHTAMNEDMEVVRHGSNTKNRVVKEQYMGDTSRGPRPDVVVSTMSAAATLDTKFDVAVVDEATQASQPSSLIPLTMAKKTILAGDHTQLPPYSSSENSESEEMHESLFEYLMDIYDSNVSVRLNRQYRMNDKIARFPNKEFYDDSLTTDSSCQDNCVGDLSPMAAFHVEGDEKIDNSTMSKYNEEEADVVANQVARIQQDGLEPEEIGVITPYSAQIGVISNALEKNGHVKDPMGIKIDTVDSFQGSEKEAIVVSFVRSNEGNHSGFLTFPDEGRRRLNVALTRAKSRCVLIGDWETLSNVSEAKSSDNSCADVYERLYNDLQDRGLLGKLEI